MNLHQGAVSAALDLSTGYTFGGAYTNRTVAKHPDTAAPIQGFSVPCWQELLGSSMLLADNLGLGYVGIDFVLDQHEGKHVLAATARPGLAVQLENRSGLLNRLQLIDQHWQAELPFPRKLELTDEMQRGFGLRAFLRIAR